MCEKASRSASILIEDLCHLPGKKGESQKLEPRKTRTSQKRLWYWLAPMALALGLILLMLVNVAHFPSNTGFWVLTSGWILVGLGGIGTVLAWMLYNVQKWPW